jgi:lipoate-protein ligase A
VNFRWLPYCEGEAAWNMAIDEAILEAHLQRRSPTTLRFYGWAPPAVSLGYAQRIDERVIADIISRGFRVVRRPTGGRAVLHQGDLTYSFVGSSSPSVGGQSNGAHATDAESKCHPNAAHSIGNHSTSGQLTGSDVALLPPSVSESYLQICEGLIQGLKRLGLDAEIGRGKGGYNRFQDCFQSTTSADLQVNGLKIVGSAQLRRKHAVLQHGSILLNQDQLLMPQLLSLATSAPTSPRHCNVFDMIGTLPIEKIEQALLEGFYHANGQRFEKGTLTDFEIELAKSLLPKYAIAG